MLLIVASSLDMRSRRVVIADHLVGADAGGLAAHQDHHNNRKLDGYYDKRDYRNHGPIPNPNRTAGRTSVHSGNVGISRKIQACR